MCLPAFRLLAFASLAASLVPAAARAQQIKGRVLILLDTSGSMGMHFADASPLLPPPQGDFPGGDGSTFYSDVKVKRQDYYHGKLLLNNTRDGVNSRLFAAKTAIADAVNGYAGGIDFGLETFDFALCPYGVPQCEPCSTLNGGYNCLYANNNFTQFTSVNWSSQGCSGTDPTWRGGRIVVMPGPGSGAKVLPWVDGVEDHTSSGDGSTTLRTPPVCQSDADCPGGLPGSCYNNLCFNCTADADCVGAVAGSCKRFPCANIKDCLGNAVGSCLNGACRPSYCVPSCASNLDCSGAACINGFCSGLVAARAGGVLVGTPANPEVRASGNTPIAESLNVARTQWYDKAKATDPQLSCRPYAVLLATDGVQSVNGGCGADPVAAARALYQANPQNPVLVYVVGMSIQAGDLTALDAIAAAGGTGKVRVANDPAAIEAAFADVLAKSVKVEYCNNIDDNCDAVVDEGYDKGAACSAGIGACTRSGIKKCAPLNSTETTCCVDDGNPNGPCVALAPGLPVAELCNGIDDNCNGLIDEGGVCQRPQCVPETCNGRDDDCDGLIDNHLIDTGHPCGLALGACVQGLTACVNGLLKDVEKGGVPDANDTLLCVGAVGPKTESCNGLDDDCDGLADGMSQPCYGGPAGTEGVGLCHGGARRCSAGAWGACTGELLPGPELCNGLDDDCDGATDDVAGAGGACCPSGKCGAGACRAGTMQCAGGGLQCVGSVGPQAESCNGIDDDCNGQVDDLASLGRPCVPQGGCVGVLACDAQKKSIVCNPAQAGGYELCNGLDDDCDGLVDEEPDLTATDSRLGLPCGVEDRPAPCAPGRTACRGGQLTCQGAVGPTAEACNCRDDDCNGAVDDDAFCPSGTRCVACGCFARCAHAEFPCPGGYTCLDTVTKSDCDTPGDNTACYCFPELPCDPPCKAGEVCQTRPPPATSGVCVSRCDGVTCPAGSFCRSGICVLDRCAGVTCDGGAACDPATGRCGKGPPPLAPEPDADDVVGAGAGGFACHIGARAGRSPLVAPALALLLALLRIRRGGIRKGEAPDGEAVRALLPLRRRARGRAT